MNARKTVIYIGMVLMVGLLLGAAAVYPAVYFQMADPAGDEYGYGTYQYPSNVAFKPYKGLFDITEFKVWAEKPDEILFDTRFAANTNPWAAPEGFIHQNLRIFIDNRPGGFNDLPQPGACVRFNSQYKWDLCLRIVGWENSRLMLADGAKMKMWPLKTELLGDGRTIRARLATSLIGLPAKTWNYYVMVGSYDGFGEDFFRKVKQKNSEWVIGGGLDRAVEPQILDILAPAKGPNSQIAQLSSFDQQLQKYAELTPVGGQVGANRWLVWLGWALALAGLSVAVLVLWLKPKKISWFWVKKGKNTEMK